MVRHLVFLLGFCQMTTIILTIIFVSENDYAMFLLVPVGIAVISHSVRRQKMSLLTLKNRIYCYQFCSSVSKINHVGARAEEGE